MFNKKNCNLVISMLRTQFLGYLFYAQVPENVNQISTNVPFMEKPGSWFLLAKCDLHLYLKCHSSAGVFSHNICLNFYMVLHFYLIFP